MARQSLQKVYADFRKGWVDVSTPLQQPEGTVKDIVNFDINIDGTLTKRPGLEISNDNPLFGSFTEAELNDARIDFHLWDNVGKDINRQFLVVRVNSEIRIFDISGGDIDIGSGNEVYSATFTKGQFNGANRKSMSGVSALGRFFIALNTFGVGYFEYNDVSGTVTFKEINPRIRDLSIWEGPNDTQTGYNKYSNTLTYPWHTYNMYNSGWIKYGYVSRESNPDNATYNTSPMGYTRRELGYWPNLPITFAACKAGAGGGINEIQAYNAWYTQNDYYGTTTPPVGRFIYDLYQFTREGEILYQTTGQAGSGYDIRGYHRETYTYTEAPSKIAFYAGRLWYAGDGEHTSSVNTSRPKSPYSSEGNIYFSQTIANSLDNAGKCYQENDPTAEDINQLLATDGGSFSLKEMGRIKGLVPLSTALFIIAENGIWRVAGIDFNTFSPDSYTIDKITDKGVPSNNGWIATEDSLYLMSNDGLFVIRSEGQIGEISYDDLSSPLIKNFFNEIPRKSIEGAITRYDENKNILYVFLAVPDGSVSSSFFTRGYNTVLIYNAEMGCFYKYRLDLSDPSAKIVDALFGPALDSSTTEDPVVDSNDEIVTDSTGATVFVAGDTVYQEFGGRITVFAGVSDGSGNYSVSPLAFTDNVSYSDLDDVGSTPNDYEAFVELGYDSLGALISDKKQAPYIISYLERDFAISEVEPEMEPV